MTQDGGSAKAEHVEYSDDKATVGCVGGFTAIALVAVIVAMANGWTIVSIIAGVLTALGLVFTVLAIRETRRWEPFELHFPEWPLTLGSTTCVRFVRRSKRSVKDRDIALTFHLECEEEATYTVGTDTRTDTATAPKR